MKFQGICLISEDVPRLAGFYARVLGAQPHGDDRHAEICAAGLNLAIFSSAGMERLAPGSMRGAGRGGFTIGFEVADVDAEYRRLTALGAESLLPPTTHPWGARSCWLRDPDGNIVDCFTPLSTPD